jgi:hypothetical protein
MVEGHASLKVKVQRRPRQLLRLTVGLQQLGLTTLHLNVSTAGATAMYSFSLKVSGGYLFIYIYTPFWLRGSNASTLISLL